MGVANGAGNVAGGQRARHTVAETYLDSASLAFRFRRDRFRHVRALIDAVLARKGTCRIVDLGGTHYYWEVARPYIDQLPIEIHLVNVAPTPLSAEVTRGPNFVSLQGDACALDHIDDNAFDVVHSNSVIEHVGSWDQMVRMARTARRLAPAYFVQTPNFWFPIEPHVRVPFFHFLPEPARCRLLMRFNVGFGGRAKNLDVAMRGVQSTNMIDARQLASLFPDAEIVRERVAGLTKSLMAIRKP